MLRCADKPKGLHPTVRRKMGVPVPLTESQLKAIFMRFDTNKDGRLSKQELQNAFASLGSHLPCWRAKQGLHQADVNRDGYISDDELEDLVKYAVKFGYTIM